MGALALLLAVVGIGTASTSVPLGLTRLFLVFVKIESVLSGSSYVIPLPDSLRQSALASAFPDGLNVTSWVLMAAVSLARTAVIDVPAVALPTVSTVLLLRYKINSAWLVLGGALGGLLHAAGLLG